MEVITKSVEANRSSNHVRIVIPVLYLKLANIESGDYIRIKPNINGYFLIEKSSMKDDKALIIHRDNNFHFPAELMHKYRITQQHKVQIFMNKGRIIFSFNKVKDEKYI